MGFHNTRQVHLGIRSVRIRPGIYINIVAAGQFSVDGDLVVAVNGIGIHYVQISFKAADPCFGQGVQVQVVAGAEDQVPLFKFTFLFQHGAFLYGDLAVLRSGIDAVDAHVFGHAAAFSFHLVGKFHVVMGVINLSARGGHSRSRFYFYAGIGCYDRGRLHIRRKVKHAAHVHMVIVCLVFPGAGSNVVFRQNIGCACIQHRALRQYDFCISRYVVVGFRPVYAGDAAGPCPGRSSGGNRFCRCQGNPVFDIPLPGQGGPVGGFGVQRYGRGRTHGNSAAGIPVRITGGADGSVGGHVQHIDVPAACGNCTLIIAGSFRVAHPYCKNQADGSITHIGFMACIILGCHCQVGDSFFLTGFIILIRFIVFFAYGHSGRCPGSCQRFIGIDGGADAHAGSMGLGIGGRRSFIADYRVQSHIFTQQAVPVCYDNPRPGRCLRLALHDRNAYQGRCRAAGFRLDHRRVDRIHFHSIRRKGVITALYIYGGIAGVCCVSQIHCHSYAAGAYACCLGFHMAGAGCLQGNFSRHFFFFVLSVVSLNCGRLRRQFAAAGNGHKAAGFILVVGHAHRGGDHRRTGTDHQRFAPGRVNGLQRQIAVGGADGAFVDCNAGASFRRKACVTYANASYARAGLYRAQPEGVFVICLYVALFSPHGHTGAFNG